MFDPFIFLYNLVQGSVQAIFVTMFLTMKKKKKHWLIEHLSVYSSPQNNNSHDLSQPHAIPDVNDFLF